MADESFFEVAFRIFILEAEKLQDERITNVLIWSGLVT